jgi:hypothetical protein
MPKAITLVAALVTSLVAAPALARSAAAESVELRYAVHVGGLHLFDSTIRARIDGDRYELAMDAASRGIADWLTPYSGRVVAAGAIGADGVRPERFMSQRRFRGEDRAVSIDYADGGPREAVEPEAARDDRDPVPAGLKPGTIDPLSAGLAAMLAARSGRCQAVAAVFDGLARYDLLAGDRGAVRLAPGRYGIFAGDALACSVEHRMLAGFWRGRRDEGRERDRPERRPVSAWLAPIGPRGLPLPVRVEAEGWFGYVVIHLVGGSGLGLDPQSAEAEAP